MSHQRQWLEMHGSEDSHARALVGRRHRPGPVAERRASQPLRPSFPARPRPRWAASVPRARGPSPSLPFTSISAAFSGDRAVSQMRDVLTDMLADLFRANSAPEWQWFERIVTYDNAKLSHAMILSGHWTSQPEILDMGLRSLRWLLKAQTAEAGHFAPDRLPRLLDAGRGAGALRSAAARGARDGIRLSRGLRRDARSLLAHAARASVSSGSSGATISACRSTIPPPAAAGTLSCKTISTKTRALNPASPSTFPSRN